MKQLLNKIPIPIVGLALGLMACGNLVASYGIVYRYIFGSIGFIIIILVSLKLLVCKDCLKETMNNPVAASVFPTYSMAIMLSATYLQGYIGPIAKLLWYFAIILHIVLIVWFSNNYLKDFKIKTVFPSWYIVFVGIVVASVTAPAMNAISIGKIAFWFGLIAFIILLPIICKRIFFIKEMPEITLPTLVIMAAPASLLLAGYMSTFGGEAKIMMFSLLIVSQLTYLLVLVKLPSLLKIKFCPSYSAFTFPLVISAIGMKLTLANLLANGYNVAILKYLLKFEEIVAVLIVIYVCIKYFQFIVQKQKCD